LRKLLNQLKKDVQFLSKGKLDKMQKISKPWGYEIIYAHDNGQYLGKKLHIQEGSRLSFQDHLKKHETFYLEQGTAEITINDKTYRVSDKDDPEKRVFVIKPRVKHRISAITQCIVLESSTDHPNDVCRYEDDYGRESAKK